MIGVTMERKLPVSYINITFTSITEFTRVFVGHILNPSMPIHNAGISLRGDWSLLLIHNPEDLHLFVASDYLSKYYC
jgi:hypothetical protein